MKVACLVNQYPKITHSFIRREILALELHGLEVERISIRPWEVPLLDEADRAESGRTRVLLQAGNARLLATSLGAAAATPRRMAAALRQALALGARSDTGVLRHLAYVIEASILRRWCIVGGIDHLHAHFGTNPTTVAMLCRVLGGPPYSFTVHGPEEFERAAGIGLREKIAGAAFVVAVCESGRRQLEAFRGDAGPPIHVVRCGVDEAFLAPVASDIPSGKRLVCVGRLCEQKDHLTLLDAAHQLAAAGEPFELILIGDGPLRGAIEGRISALGLADHVRLIGWASSAEVRADLLGARALVLSSRAEGLPVVLMEALALGRPVIATRIAGIPELVNETCGWLVPPGAVDPLATAMRAVLRASTEQLAQMARSGAARVRQRHNADIEAGKLASLFRTGRPQ